MSKKIVLTAILSIGFSVLCPHNARATIYWDWQFTNNNQYVTSLDIVALEARLTNLSDDSETIGSIGAGATAFIQSASAGAVPGYSADLGPTINGLSLDFFSQFNVALEYGEFVDFTFAKYSPVVAISDGTYTSFVNNIGLSLSEDRSELGQITRCASWNVGDAQGDGCHPTNGDPAVPEPASMLLFGSGIIGAVFQKKRQAA